MKKLVNLFRKTFIFLPLIYIGFSLIGNLNVSLTYLRGLEVAELKEEDMPMV